MPNHITNKLEFSGEPEDIKALLDFVKSEEQAFDFNKIIPMPESLRIEEGSKSRLSHEAYIYTNGLVGNFSGLLSGLKIYCESMGVIISLKEYIQIQIDEKLLDIELGKKVCNNLHNYGFASWYDWSNEKWGTKWNAYEVSVTEKNTIFFDTAWGAPLPVIEKLAEFFPQVKIEHWWADEDMGSNCGHIIYENKYVEAYYIDDQSQEAFAIYVELNGENNCLGVDEAGNYYCKECSDCNDCAD